MRLRLFFVFLLFSSFTIFACVEPVYRINKEEKYCFLEFLPLATLNGEVQESRLFITFDKKYLNPQISYYKNNFLEGSKISLKINKNIFELIKDGLVNYAIFEKKIDNNAAFEQLLNHNGSKIYMLSMHENKNYEISSYEICNLKFYINQLKRNCNNESI